ncbi:MAG: hypothetical protein K2G87_01685 [Oscillospiraceae bacterium]|nr:hypothetical protein [Oscillospiraceae bacterium]
MSDLLREFYGSDMCEASHSFKLSEEGESALAIREDVYKQLEKNLNKEDFELFERYINTNSIVWSEEVFHAYVGGMRDLIRLATGIFM